MKKRVFGVLVAALTCLGLPTLVVARPGPLCIFDEYTRLENGRWVTIVTIHCAGDDELLDEGGLADGPWPSDILPEERDSYLCAVNPRYCDYNNTIDYIPNHPRGSEIGMTPLCGAGTSPDPDNPGQCKAKSDCTVQTAAAAMRFGTDIPVKCEEFVEVVAEQENALPIFTALGCGIDFSEQVLGADWWNAFPMTGGGAAGGAGIIFRGPTKLPRMWLRGTLGLDGYARLEADILILELRNQGNRLGRAIASGNAMISNLRGLLSSTPTSRLEASMESATRHFLAATRSGVDLSLTGNYMNIARQHVGLTSQELSAAYAEAMFRFASSCN